VFVNLVKCNSKALKNVNLILIGLNYLFAYRKTRIVELAFAQSVQSWTQVFC